MTLYTIGKVKKAIDLCNKGNKEPSMGSCAYCPYRVHDDRCVKVRNKDLNEVLDWAADVYKIVKQFTTLKE